MFGSQISPQIPESCCLLLPVVLSGVIRFLLFFFKGQNKTYHFLDLM